MDNQAAFTRLSVLAKQIQGVRVRNASAKPSELIVSCLLTSAVPPQAQQSVGLMGLQVNTSGLLLWRLHVIAGAA